MSIITKAKCIAQYKQLNEVLDLGDEVEIESILSDREITLIPKTVVKVIEGKKVFEQEPEVIAPIGTMLGWRFKSKNGNYYDDVCIRQSIGFVSINDLFEPL